MHRDNVFFTYSCIGCFLSQTELQGFVLSLLGFVLLICFFKIKVSVHMPLKNLLGSSCYVWRCNRNLDTGIQRSLWECVVASPMQMVVDGP